MKSEYPEFIKKSVQALCDEIIKYHPDILNIKYNEDNMNDLDENESIFKQRMEMALYIELIRAGIIK